MFIVFSNSNILPLAAVAYSFALQFSLTNTLYLRLFYHEIVNKKTKTKTKTKNEQTNKTLYQAFKETQTDQARHLQVLRNELFFAPSEKRYPPQEYECCL